MESFLRPKTHHLPNSGRNILVNLGGSLGVVIVKCEFEEINVPWELFRGVSTVGRQSGFPFHLLPQVPILLRIALIDLGGLLRPLPLLPLACLLRNRRELRIFLMSRA